jgi:pilus assembly protein Flp/PilA
MDPSAFIYQWRPVPPDRHQPRRTISMVDFLLSRYAAIDSDEGQGLAEYALILALIAIVAIVALLFLGGQIATILSQIGKAI